MAIRVIDKGCRIEEGKLIITIEGASPDEVLSNSAKMLALEKAASYGYHRIGINGQSGSFPVDASGNTYENWNDPAKIKQIAAYRNEIKLMSGA